MLTTEITATGAPVAQWHFDGAPLRVIHDENGDPWFVAKDVADILGVSTEQTRRLDDDEKGLRTVQTLGGAQEVTAINEFGLYSLVLTSRKAEAKRFKRWITHDVVPAIRKTGKYDSAPTLPNFADPVAAARAWADAEESKQKLQIELAAAAPAIEFVDRYADSTGLKGFRQVCKLLGAKEPAFRQFLKDEKIMYPLGGEWVPFAQHLDAGRFAVKAGTSERTGHAYNSGLFTAKGVAWVAGEFAKWQLKQKEGQHA